MDRFEVGILKIETIEVGEVVLISFLLCEALCTFERSESTFPYVRTYVRPENNHFLRRGYGPVTHHMSTGSLKLDILGSRK